MGSRGDTKTQKLQYQHTVNDCKLKLLERQPFQPFQNEHKVREKRGHVEEREIRTGLRYGTVPSLDAGDTYGTR